jgi:hypothetical protein
VAVLRRRRRNENDRYGLPRYPGWRMEMGRIRGTIKALWAERRIEWYVILSDEYNDLIEERVCRMLRIRCSI